mgnify:CR=1 FL=1
MLLYIYIFFFFFSMEMTKVKQETIASPAYSPTSPEPR